MSKQAGPRPPPRNRPHKVPPANNLPKPNSFDEYDQSNTNSYYAEEQYYAEQDRPITDGSSGGSVSNSFQPVGIMQETPETTIGAAVKMNGELAFASLLRVDGHFTGTLISEGSLIVGQTGNVTGDVKGMKQVVIDGGKIIGDVEVEKVVLQGKGVIYGNITCKSFTMSGEAIVVGIMNVNPFAPSKIDNSLNVITEIPELEPAPTPLDLPEPVNKKIEEKKEEASATEVEAKTAGENKEAPKTEEVSAEAPKVEPNSEAQPAPLQAA